RRPLGHPDFPGRLTAMGVGVSVRDNVIIMKHRNAPRQARCERGGGDDMRSWRVWLGATAAGALLAGSGLGGAVAAQEAKTGGVLRIVATAEPAVVDPIFGNAPGADKN